MVRQKTEKKSKGRPKKDNEIKELNREAARISRDAEEQKKNQLREEWKTKFDEIGKTLGLKPEEIDRRKRLVTDFAGPSPNRFKDGVPCGVLKSKFWTLKHELEHRWEFLKRARIKLKFHFNGSGPKYDKNLDKHFDFIMREEDGGTLEHLSDEDLFGPNGRLHESQDVSIMNPIEALKYVSSNKVQRRTFWIMKNEVEKVTGRQQKGLQPKRWQPGQTGYCSSNLLDSDVDTNDFGYYVWQQKVFLPWEHIDNVFEDLVPFKEALDIMSNYIMQKTTSGNERDRVKNLNSSNDTRDRNPDRTFADAGPLRTAVAAKPKPSVETLKANAFSAVSSINKSFMTLKMSDFEKKWSRMVTFSALGLPKYQNAVWTVVRILHSTNSLVFSNPGQFEYDPKSQSPFRSADEILSYADEEFANLVTNFDLKDSDGKLSLCKSFKVFMNEKMKREGLPAYKLKPYSFIFNSKTHIIKLAENGAANLFCHHRHLYYAVDTILNEIVHKLATTERELKRRILVGEDDDEVYGSEEQLRPLVLPFLNFSEEVHDFRLKRRRFKRASFRDLENPQFPYRDRIFLEAMLCSTRIVSDGKDVFAYFEQSGWEKQESDEAGAEVQVRVEG